MSRLIFSAATREEALERASERLGLPIEALEHELLEDAKEEYAEEDSGVCIRVRVGIDHIRDKACELLERLLEEMDLPGDITDQIEHDTVRLQIASPKGSLLIGRDGATLESMQHWLGRAMSRFAQSGVSILLDIEGYRERKFERLEQMALRLAARTAQTGRSNRLQDMTASERKFIHTCLKDIEGVTTFSIGREGYRHIVIAPEEEEATGDEGPAMAEGPEEAAEAGEEERDLAPEAPQDELLSSASAFSELRVIATPEYSDTDEGDEELDTEISKGFTLAEDDGDGKDGSDQVEDELH